MMIRRAQTQEIIKAYKAQNNERPLRPVEKAKGVSPKDDVRLSVQKADVDTVMKAVSSLPDVRKDKVDSVKDALKSGTYNVDPEEVADSILRRLLADEIK